MFNPRAAILLGTLMFATAMSAWMISGPLWVILSIITISYGLFLSLVTIS